MLKNLRIKARHSNMEFKITGLSEKPCNQQQYVFCSFFYFFKNFVCLSLGHLLHLLFLFSFPLKMKNGDDANNEDQTIEITVYEYFTKHRGIELSTSAYMPCVNVGKPKRPNYLPLEVCNPCY